MNILIAGAGKVGKSLTKELSAEGHDITLIEQNPKVIENALEKYDINALEGNSASMNTLLEADVKNMDVLIAATNADEVNLLSCITAKALNPKIHTIARIRDPEYVEQASTMRDVFKLSLLINPEKQAAQEIARQLKYPGFLKRETFAKAKVEIVELKVGKGSKLANVQLSNLSNTVRAQVLVCAVVREGKSIMPDGTFVLKENDRIFVTGSPNQLHDMLIHIGIINMPVSHAIVTGGGTLSYYLAEELQKAHITTSIVEINPVKCEEISRRLPYVTVINSDISDHSVLDSEDVGEYDAFVSATGLDELNIVSSMYAHLRKVPQIVTKLGRGDTGSLIDQLPIGSIVCPKDLCTMHIVRYVRAMQNKHGAALTIHRIADGYAEAIEFRVDSDTKHIGEPLKDLKTKDNVLIVSIGHGTHTEIPNGNSSFNEGDIVVVITNKDQVAVNQLNDIFQE